MGVPGISAFNQNSPDFPAISGPRSLLRRVEAIANPTAADCGAAESILALPFVDFLQRSSHERCLVVLGQAFGVAERRDALLIAQHANRPRPVGAPHATIQPERIDDPQYRLPDIVVWERLVRHRAGTADLHPYVLVLSQGEQLG